MQNLVFNRYSSQFFNLLYKQTYFGATLQSQLKNFSTMKSLQNGLKMPIRISHSQQNDLYKGFSSHSTDQQSVQKAKIIKDNEVNSSKVLRSIKLKNINIQLDICQGDIVSESSDAIVCSADNFLKFEGDVASQIVKSAGKSIVEETEHIIDTRIMIPTGTCAVTTAGQLNTKYVIHTVGPNLNDPGQLGLDKDELLAFSIKNTIDIAENMQCASLSMPAISSGSFGFPKEKCAQIMLETLMDYDLQNYHFKNLTHVRLINNDEKTVEAFVNEFDEVFTDYK